MRRPTWPREHVWLVNQRDTHKSATNAASVAATSRMGQLLERDHTLSDAGLRTGLETLEHENRELCWANESLLVNLGFVICTMPSAPGWPGSVAGDIVDLPASPSMRPPARADESAQWKEAVEGEAPWETVLVPRSTSR